MPKCLPYMKCIPKPKKYRFKHRMGIQLSLIVVSVILLFVVGPGVFTQLQNNGNSSQVVSGVFASISGYLALLILIFTIALGVHFKPFELMIGLDSMWKWHKIFGIGFIISIFIHIILKYVEYCYSNAVDGDLNSVCSIGGYFEFMFLFEKYPGTYAIAASCGRAMMYFWLVQVILSLFARRPKRPRFVPHVIWYTYHVFTYPACIVIIVHCIYNKFNYISPQSITTIVITSIFAIIISLLIFYRLYNIFKISIYGYYEVLSIRKINDTLTVMNIIPIRKKYATIFKDPIQHASPGQFLQLYGPNGTIHPLSFALINRGVKKAKSIELIIRASGKYTTSLRDYKPHDRLCISGPYGFFIPPFQSQNKSILMIASGSGISPCVGSLVTYGYKRPSSCNVTIIWYIRNENDFDAINNRLELINNKFINFKLVVVSPEGQDFYYEKYPDSRHIPIDFYINTTITPEIITAQVQKLIDAAAERLELTGPNSMAHDSELDVDLSLSLYNNDTKCGVKIFNEAKTLTSSTSSSNSSGYSPRCSSENQALIRNSSVDNVVDPETLKDKIVAYVCGQKKYAKAWKKQLKGMGIPVFSENFSMI